MHMHGHAGRQAASQCHTCQALNLQDLQLHAFAAYLALMNSVNENTMAPFMCIDPHTTHVLQPDINGVAPVLQGTHLDHELVNSERPLQLC